MRIKTLVASLMVLLASTSLMAQQGPPGGPGGRPDFQQMRQQMSDRMKQSLGASDDEWKVLEPKVEKLFQLQMQTSGRVIGMSLLFGFNLNAMMGPDATPSDVQKTAGELYELLNNPSSSPSEVKSKLAAFTAARAKANIELAKAQDDLRSVLTVRQEATLVMMGLLE